MFYNQYLHVVLLLIHIGVECADNQNESDTVEYVFAIPKLGLNNYFPSLMITTNSMNAIDVTISVQNQDQDIYERVITKSTGAKILLSGIRLEPGDEKQNKTIIVRAMGDVSVYAISNSNRYGDVMQVIPSSNLGTTYYVASYQTFDIFYSCTCISALYPATYVRISAPSGNETAIDLAQYESYRYDANGLDVSGTVITSNKPISVLSGSYSKVPSKVIAADAIVAHLPPVDAWGTVYHIFPFKSLNSGFVYRVFASNIYTTLQMSDGRDIPIAPGDFYEGNVTGNTVISFTSDYDVLVAQYMKGYEANTPGRGDPSMLIVPPVSSYTNNLAFPVFEYGDAHDYYINVVTACTNIDDILLDDTTSVTSWEMLTTDGQSMCCVRHNISTDYHTITHPDANVTFFVAVYAIGISILSSYAYTATQFASAMTTTPEVTTISTKTSQLLSEAPTTTSMTTVSKTHQLLSDVPVQLVLYCNPAIINQVAPAGEASVLVHYQAVATGGTPMYTINYANDPGSRFDVGSTTVVTAIVIDADGRSATCNFKINVNTETGKPSDIVIISVIVCISVVVVTMSVLCYCLKRKRSSNDDAEPYYATSIPLSRTTSVPSDNQPGTPDSNTDPTGNVICSFENLGYQDLDLSAVNQPSSYQGLYAEVK